MRALKITIGAQTGKSGEVMKPQSLQMVIAAYALCVSAAHADCVYGAKSETSFRVLDSNTILLSGGYAGQILIKSFSFFTSVSNVTVLKDDFCDFDSSVLYVDGETVDVQQVKSIR